MFFKIFWKISFLKSFLLKAKKILLKKFLYCYTIAKIKFWGNNVKKLLGFILGFCLIIPALMAAEVSDINKRAWLSHIKEMSIMRKQIVELARKANKTSEDKAVYNDLMAKFEAKQIAWDQYITAVANDDAEGRAKIESKYAKCEKKCDKTDKCGKCPKVAKCEKMMKACKCCKCEKCECGDCKCCKCEKCDCCKKAQKCEKKCDKADKCGKCPKAAKCEKKCDKACSK